MTAQVAFLGLGVMGYPMAGHLAAAGYPVRVYNRSKDKTARWIREHRGDACDTVAQAVAGADVVFMCLGNDDSVRSVVDGPDGVLANMVAGGLLVDHTTASATLATELGTLALARGLGFVDAPVSGGEAGAQNGALTIMAGAAPADYQRADVVWSCYAKNAQLIGAVGSGQLAKMVNQICIAGVIQGLSEGLQFMQSCGLDGERVMAAISKGAAQSWQMDNRHATMAAREFEFGFAVDWMRKDLGMALAEAKRRGVDLPLTELVDQYYADVQRAGGGRWDTSSLITRLDSD